MPATVAFPRLIIRSILAAGAVLTVSAIGQETAPGAGDPTAIDALITRTLAHYRSLDSYQDRMRIKTEMVGGEALWFLPTTEVTATTAFAKPLRFATVSESMTAQCDGRTAWLAIPLFGQYTATAVANGQEASAALQSPMGDAHPLAALLLQPDQTIGQLFPMVTAWERMEAAERDGAAGQRLFGRLDPGMGDPLPVPFSVWIGTATGLVGEIRVDVTAQFREMAVQMADMVPPDGDPARPAPAALEKAEVVVTFEDVVVNAPIPAERFAFEPGNLRRVEQFDMWQAGGAAQPNLVGQPAPTFEARDLDDRPITLTDYKDRVVVLDFWATWCAPCVQALPDIQKVAEHFKDRPVTVLGINQDQGRADRAVRQMLERLKITFRQVMDPKDAIGKQYGVNGIPYMVLIDRAGVVQDVQVGYGPGKDAQLKLDIERLLDPAPAAADPKSEASGSGH